MLHEFTEEVVSPGEHTRLVDVVGVWKSKNGFVSFEKIFEKKVGKNGQLHILWQLIVDIQILLTLKSRQLIISPSVVKKLLNFILKLQIECLLRIKILYSSKKLAELLAISNILMKLLKLCQNLH